MKQVIKRIISDFIATPLRCFIHETCRCPLIWKKLSRLWVLEGPAKRGIFFS